MAALDLLGRGHVLRLVWELRDESVGFREMQARCDGLSPSTLSQRLTDLRDAGLIVTLWESAPWRARMQLGGQRRQLASRDQRARSGRQDVPMAEPVDLSVVLARFDEPWSPRTVAVLNDYDIRVVKTQGEFTRHRHLDTDEVFLVLSGSLTIRLDQDEITLGPGQLYVVPRGVHHQPVSVDGAEVLLIEPSATVNTGDNPGHLTAERRLG